MTQGEFVPVSIPEFEALQHLLQHTLSADRIAAARMVMVDGNSYQEAADKFAVTRQAVWKTVQRMRETLQVYKEACVIEEAAIDRTLPRGWRRATITAPAAIVERSLAEAQAAHQARLHQVAEAGAALLATSSLRRRSTDWQ